MLSTFLHAGGPEGAAAPEPQERPSRLRGRGRNVGTAEYMPPEMIVDTKISFAADWWALGCVLFQCLVRSPSPPAFTAVTHARALEAPPGAV